MLKYLEPGWREVQAADTQVGAEPGAFKSVETDELMGTGEGCVSETKSQDCVHRNPNILGLVERSSGGQRGLK